MRWPATTACPVVRGRQGWCSSVEELGERRTHVDASWVMAAEDPVEDGADELGGGLGHGDSQHHAGDVPGDHCRSAFPEKIMAAQKLGDGLVVLGLTHQRPVGRSGVRGGEELNKGVEVGGEVADGIIVGWDREFVTGINGAGFQEDLGLG